MRCRNGCVDQKLSQQLPSLTSSVVLQRSCRMHMANDFCMARPYITKKTSWTILLLCHQTCSAHDQPSPRPPWLQTYYALWTYPWHQAGLFYLVSWTILCWFLPKREWGGWIQNQGASTINGRHCSRMRWTIKYYFVLVQSTHETILPYSNLTKGRLPISCFPKSIQFDGSLTCGPIQNKSDPIA